MTREIEVIAFDLGGVLIEVDHDSAMDWLLERGCRVAAAEEFVELTGMEAHERGELSADAFLGRVNALLAQPQTPLALARWWTSLFRPCPEMLTLARELRRYYRVCILSNTGSLHWARAREQFGLDEITDDALTSFQAGVAKPDARIYALAMQRFGVRAEGIVFVDDLEPNVAAAIEAGWRGVRHGDFDTTRAALRGLGVRIG